ncbi:MAG: alkylmercury lyase family protein, partial [Actinomycetota bacterium]|nr:alkylmercury lyase family protein [Actinomycetota bacterium]
PPHARELHIAVLSSFALHGQAPSLESAAALDELVRADLVALDEDGEIRAAYPFSPTPTGITVTWPRGPRLHAMCAIDALGVSAMLDRPVVVTASDPVNRADITVTVRADRAEWSPRLAVIYLGSTGVACGPSVDATCPSINFFSGAETAQQWAQNHPAVTGRLLEHEEALELAVDEFSQLLGGRRLSDDSAVRPPGLPGAHGA